MQKYPIIIGILEFRSRGLSYSTIQKRWNVGASTVRRTVCRFEELGMSLEELKAHDPAEVQELFYPSEEARRKDAPLPDFQKCFDRIHQKGSKANLTFLWYEYKEQYPDGYQLTQFCEYYRRFVEQSYGSESVSMAVERIPGEKMYIDWAGDQPELLADPQTGELKKVHIFVTTLGFSSMGYAEVFEDEKLPSFIKGCMNAVSFYGGTTRYWVPDNLKTAVTKHTKDELTLNSMFKDLESYFDVVVLPPPPRKPKGKATVEGHVKYLETHLIEKLKGSLFYSIADINARTKEIIATINSRKGKREATRLELFEMYDRPCLKAANTYGFLALDYKAVPAVPANYHIGYDGHYYSIYYKYYGRPAILKAGFNEITICDEFNREICKHKRVYAEFPKYVTIKEHMPEAHQFYYDINTRDGNYYRSWAQKLSPSLGILIDRILKRADFEPQAYNSCSGILHKVKDERYQIIENAASFCIGSGNATYSGFMKALAAEKTGMRNGFASSNEAGLPLHQNIRGKEEYR